MRIEFNTQIYNTNKSVKKNFNPTFGNVILIDPENYNKRRETNFLQDLVSGLSKLFTASPSTKTTTVVKDPAPVVKTTETVTVAPVVTTYQTPVHLTKEELAIKRREQRLEQQRLAKQRRLTMVKTSIYDLLNKYRMLTGNEYKVNKWKNLGIKQLEALETQIKEDVNHELLMKELEKQFRKGEKYYRPRRPRQPIDAFSAKSLHKISPQENFKSYKEELNRICRLYLENSSIFDCSAEEFNKLTRRFFSTAAADFKEIFAIGDDTKLLERIPKLGIIPKALRVCDQTRLVNCVKQDYDDVTEAYVKNGFVPIIDKYNSQYNVIQDFVKTHSVKALIYKSFTEKCMKKMEEAQNNRSKLSSKLLQTYTKAGSNFCNVCKKVKKDGAIDLIRKAIFTFGSFI